MVTSLSTTVSVVVVEVVELAVGTEFDDELEVVLEDELVVVLVDVLVSVSVSLSNETAASERTDCMGSLS